MVKRGLLGQKTGAGFFKKQGKEIRESRPRLDALGVPPAEKVRSRPLGAAKGVEDAGPRIKKISGDDKAAKSPGRSSPAR